ncbi:transposase [Staphylococcus coagulans]|uniref:transposase n=1 Tax=Staphylococcus coagulans TaxID=74706 RepID=UPI0030ECA5DC
MNNAIIINSLKKSRLTIPRVSEKAAYLILKKQRYYCKKCCSYFTAETSIVARDCFISHNTRLAVLNKAADIRSQKSISQSCHVSCSTVSRIVNQAASQVAQTPFKFLLEHLMMDEFKSLKIIDGKMSFIYADAITHRIVDIIPDCRLFALKNYFYRFPLSERNRVKTVSIDMKSGPFLKKYNLCNLIIGTMAYQHEIEGININKANSYKNKVYEFVSINREKNDEIKE